MGPTTQHSAEARAVVERALRSAQRQVTLARQQFDAAQQQVQALTLRHGELVLADGSAEIVESRDEVRVRLAEVYDHIEHESLSINANMGQRVDADYIAYLEDTLDSDLRYLRAGVKSRVIVESDYLDDDGLVGAWYQRLAGAGELQRVVPQISRRLVIVDRRVAFVPLADRGPCGALIVRNPVVIASLVASFDALWSQLPSLAVAGQATSLLTAVDRVILELLGEGLQDEAVARRLGVSPRTVRRRLAVLMDLLGVQTRFQLGMCLPELLRE